MRILLINPNTTQSTTEAMTTVARQVAGQQAEIFPVTARTGFPDIFSPAEAQIAGADVLEIIASHQSEVDAVIIAAFGDPGLTAARELFDLPIIGMAGAAVMSAALLGKRFGIVTSSPFMARCYSDCVQGTGLGDRFTGVRCPVTAPETLDNVATGLRQDLIDLTREAKTLDGADVVVMGGAPLAGLAPLLARDAPCILVDPIASATVQALASSSLAPRDDNRTNRPARQSATDFGPELTAVIAGEKS